MEGKNRLQFEKSPYLLQHQHNPVDWYPWGDEAFEKAQNENKPVFLSIGYSTCHWCHVMERESFENPGVAALMNDAFVSIKVDREERPDIDGIYMTVCQMMTGSGGWPLTIIMTPEKKPFFAATYIPRENKWGRAGMLDLVPRIREIWQQRQDEIQTSADQITDALHESVSRSPGEDLRPDTLRKTFEHFSQNFDEFYGGFGNAPKFPTPHNFLFLLRYWKRSNDPKALQMVEGTLRAMRAGGIYDHLGFGFHRYSTDARWLVPHFEKMLYDQALLAMAFIETYQETGREEYKRTAEELFTYVLRDMTSPDGAFYSAEDADSEGKEGLFYFWTTKELQTVLTAEEAAFAIKVFNVRGEGNFVDQIEGGQTGENILHVTSFEQIVADLNMPEQEFRSKLESIRSKLFLHREKRIHPHKDDKVLTDWNGLMIAAMAKAARAFARPDLAQAAEKAAGFFTGKMSLEDGSLLHRFRDGAAGITSHLDDYAFLVWGLIELYETTFSVSHLKKALQLTDYMLEHFWDVDGGGLYFTSDEGESLLVRQKENYDGAVPSGNSVAMLNLLRLARITGNSGLEQKASQLARAFSGGVRQMPAAHTLMMTALDFAIGPAFEVVIAGDPRATDTRALLDALHSRFLPSVVTVLRPAGEDAPEISTLAPFTAQQLPVKGRAAAFVCVNHACNAPTTDPAAMLKLLKS